MIERNECWPRYRAGANRITGTYLKLSIYSGSRELWTPVDRADLGNALLYPLSMIYECLDFCNPSDDFRLPATWLSTPAASHFRRNLERV